MKMLKNPFLLVYSCNNESNLLNCPLNENSKKEVNNIMSFGVRNKVLKTSLKITVVRIKMVYFNINIKFI